MPKKVEILVKIALVAIILIPHLYAASTPAASVMNFYKTDDAYYYFIVARNVAAGHGFTFDLINRTNGFHPLWMFINIPIFMLANSDPILPLRVIVVIMALLTAGTGLLIFELLKKYINPWLSAFAALFWVLYPRIHQVVSEDGLEAGLNAFFLVLLLISASWYRDRLKSHKGKGLDLVWVGLTASMALFSRLDNIFTVILVGAWLIFRDLPIKRQLVIDEILIIIGIFGAAITRFGVEGEYSAAMFATYVMLILAILIKPIVFDLLAMDKDWVFHGRRFFGLKIILVSGIASLVLGLVMLTLSGLGVFSVFPRSYIIYDWIISTFLFICSRYFFRGTLYMSPVSLWQPWIQWIKSSWQRFLKEGFSYFGPMAILMILYLTWNYIYFGTAMPISGQIKHWWAELPNTVYHHDTTLKVFLGLSPNLDYGPWSLITRSIDSSIQDGLKALRINNAQFFWISCIVLVGLSFILIWKLFRMGNSRSGEKSTWMGIAPLLLGCLAQISYYNATNYPNTRSWYWVGEILFIVLFIALLLDLLIIWLSRMNYGRILSYSALAIFTILLVKNNLSYISKVAPRTLAEGYEEFYLADARGLEAYTPPGAVVGMTGGGTVSYFVRDRTIINMDGLMNSADYFEGMKKGIGADFLDRWGVQFIFADEYIVTSSDPYMGMLANRLERIGKVRGPENFTLFKYLPQSEEPRVNP